MPDQNNVEVPTGACLPRKASRGNSPAPVNCPAGAVTQGSGSLHPQSRSQTDRHRPLPALSVMIIIWVICFPEAAHCCVIGLSIGGVITLLFGTCSNLFRCLYLKT